MEQGREGRALLDAAAVRTALRLHRGLSTDLQLSACGALARATYQRTDMLHDLRTEIDVLAYASLVGASVAYSHPHVLCLLQQMRRLADVRAAARG